MEVINRLTTSITLPPDFFHKYISNCARACEETENPRIQHRQVRLVCVFTQALFRNNIIDVSDFLIPLQAFCLQFPKSREAADLFRFLRGYEMEGGVEAFGFEENVNEV